MKTFALFRSTLLLLTGLVLLCNAQDNPFTTTTGSPVTTAAPITTTAPTTTTTAPTNGTTTSTTTTVAPPTTSEPPTPTTPVPEPDVGIWTFTNQTNNQTCVITQMALQLNVTYVNTDNKTVHTLYDVPKDAKVINGSCGADFQFITLSWGTPSVTPSWLNLSFRLNLTEHEFVLAGLTFSLIIPDANASKALLLQNNETMFKTPMDMSYHCNRAQKLNLTWVDDPTAKLDSTVTISKLQFEAFHKNQNSKFSIAKDCDAIDTPDIVPIAVGCALILLIVIVLIAYLAGRRSTRSRGYLSM